MAEIAAAFLGPAIEVVKLVAKPIKRQFNYLCCFTSNINNLRNEAKRLGDATQALQVEVDRAIDNVQVIVPSVNTWLTDSNGINGEINGILNEATNVESGCLKLGARFSLSKRAKKTTKRSKEHRGQNNFVSISQPGPPPAAQTVPGGKTYEFESRKKIEDEIMTTLRDGDVNLIGIYGMGGLGKNTMAHKIRNKVLNGNVFQEVAMTVVSQEADKSKIQVEIGGQLGLYLTGETWQGQVQKLHARLSDTKRSLVILDDVWEGLELEDLGIPCDSEWCTILITSRNEDALSKMGCKVENKFGMKILSEEEAWCLFREGAGTCVDGSNLNAIAKEVVKECKGFPIALKTLGLALKEKDDAFIWYNALRELKEGAADISDYIKKVYTPLIMSYNFLNSEMAKSLFLLCCLFPEDDDIPLEHLTYFCMGLGIFEGIRNLEDARNKMCSLIDTLKRRSLLFDSYDEGHVRMHDVVRDVCIYLAKQKRCIGGNDCAWISSSQRVGERSELLTESRFPNLRLLFLRPVREEFEFGSAFLEGIKDLYVLGINFNRRLTSLPHATQSLVNLKTLLLVWCQELKTISVVGKLVNLEILICRNCESIEELPLEMKGLNRLKLLDITGCRKLQSIGRGIISSLVGLEELKILLSFNKWEAEDREERENAALRELEALTNLRCLEIQILDRSLLMGNRPFLSKKIVKFIIRSDRGAYLPYGFSQGMSLCLEREGRLGDWIEKQLLKDTECLCLEGDGANNVELAKIQHIRWLQLRNCDSMKNVVTTSGGSDDAAVFPSIELMRLTSLPELQEICDGPILSTSFQNLKELKLKDLRALTQFWKSCSVPQNNNVPHFSNLSSIRIYKCDGLRNLGQLSMAGKDCLPQLEELSIIRCAMMEQVFVWNNTSIEPRHVIFPKLKKVKLLYLKNLTTFYQGIQGIQFPLLQHMNIDGCPKMKSIIMASNENNNSGEITSSSADQDIDDDDTLHLFCQSQKVSFGSSLKVLEMNHNPFCLHEIPSSLFNGLEELTINKYEGSLSIFTLSVARNLVSLIELRIRNCAEMIKVIEDDQQQQRILLFPKLRRLELKSLPKLVIFCGSKCEVELPSLITDLTTYAGVGVGVDVAFDSLKELEISDTKNPFVDRKISVSLFNGLEKLTFWQYKGSMSLFSSSAIGNLVNLRVLEIEYCDEIVKVIEEDEEKEDGKVASGGVVFLPKLEMLRLVCLQKLVRFCEWKCDVEFPSLKHVEITHCHYMENFSLGFVVAPNLDTFRLNYILIEDAKDLNGALQQHYLARQDEEEERRRMEEVRRRRREEEEGGEEEQETKDEIEEENQN